jgi:DNA-binding HxlR family transcriptional regulator
MDIDRLVKLTSRAWSLSILARLDAGTPGRQAALLAATGAGRTAFAQSLAHLIALGLIERNPGHGHPLRPEFRLTAEGLLAAAMASRIEQQTSAPDAQTLLRRSWTLPVLSATRRPRHFSEIKTTLSAITDRALSLTLSQLQTRLWVERRIDPSGRPPRPLYQAANAGAEIVVAVGPLTA